MLYANKLQRKSSLWHILDKSFWGHFFVYRFIFMGRHHPLYVFFTFPSYKISEKNNLDIGSDIAEDLEKLKDNLNQFKKSNPGADLGDVDIQQLDWVEDNKRVKAFFIYESSV